MSQQTLLQHLSDQRVMLFTMQNCLYEVICKMTSMGWKIFLRADVPIVVAVCFSNVCVVRTLRVNKWLWFSVLRGKLKHLFCVCLLSKRYKRRGVDVTSRGYPEPAELQRQQLEDFSYHPG